MQTDIQRGSELVPIPSVPSEGSSTPAASFYRTMWLMAHNRLHAATHDPAVSLPELWAAYLADMETAEEKSSVPA